MVAEEEVEEEEVDWTYPTKGTQTFNKKTETIKEPSEEGGASMPNKIVKSCHLRATIAERSAIVKRKCRIRRSESTLTSRQLTNYTTYAEYANYGGLFIMRHRA